MSSAEPATPTEARTEKSLHSQMRTGALLWGLGNAASRVLRFGAQFLLVWLLLPADFGLVAMTTALMNVLQMVSEFGVGIAVIQKKDMKDGYVHTAFWLNLAASVLILAVAWVTAPWIAAFYGAEEVTWLVRITSLSFPITALRTIPMSLLRRRMQFGVNSALETAWNGISGALMIAFAWFGASYWSLVVPSMIVSVLMTPLWFAYAKWRPAFAFDGAEFWELLHYSKNLVGASLLSLVLSNAGFVIAGHLLGKDAAGLYNVATTYSMIVLINYAWLIGNVSLSGFAAKQGDAEALRDGFVRIYELLAATTLPVHVLGIVLAPLLFDVFLPERYAAAERGFQLLLAYSAVRSLAAHVAPFYNAINRAYVNFFYLLFATPVCIVVMYFACKHYLSQGGVYAGLDALAWATLLTQGTSVFCLLAVMKWVMGWRGVGLVRRVMPFLVAAFLASVAAVGVMVAHQYFATGLPVRIAGFLALCIATALGAGVYVVTLYFLARRQFAVVLRDAIPGKFRNRFLYSWFPALRENPVQD
ncbi:MAG TPA: lipopolysaccharide biosynthesis protein [Candidatus Hydrogenedentes bacterium]|nr:lipopolysaccharide biosynthesis protein [Candidatus Hydrogenedentota bacterium]